MKRILVDTDVVSYGFRMDPVFVSFYGPELNNCLPMVSFMTIGEMEFGAKNRNWGEKRAEALRLYLAANYVQLGVSNAIARRWGEATAEAQAKGRVLHCADGWIAATALSLNMPLMTNNRRDYDFLDGLTIISAA